MGGQKGRIAEGELDFVVQNGTGATLDVAAAARPFGLSYSVSPPLPSGAGKDRTPTHQAFAIELNNRLVTAPRLKIPARISGRANTGGCWPLAFQVEPFDFNKVQVDQIFNVKSWPAPPPTP